MQAIMDAVDRVLGFIRDIPLGGNTIKRYDVHYRHSILPYCETNGIELFSDDAMHGYLKNEMSRVEDGKLNCVVFRLQRKAASLLADCMQGRTLAFARSNYAEQKLCGHFGVILDDYITFLSKCSSPGTVRQRSGCARRFVVFLEKCGVMDICGLTPEHVRDYIAAVSQAHRACMPTLTSAIRKVLSYLNESGHTAINAERYLVNPAPARKKVFPCFTDDEAEAILNSVERATALGKRDYAILKTALWTGLRGVDIFGIKRADIDWDKKVINVTQDKTGVYFQARMPSSVGNAIADYILNGRPETDSPHIFVSHIVPYDRLQCGGANIIRRYLDNAGISHEAWDGKTFHALRRTMGTRLVRAGVPVRTVGEMLGQLNLNSARRYVALDNHGLRKCCMDITAFKTGKEGLS
jgi:site-specific recombinase XerD